MNLILIPIPNCPARIVKKTQTKLRARIVELNWQTISPVALPTEFSG